MIFEKTAGSERCSREDTHPTDFLRADDIPQRKVHAHGDQYGQDRKSKLSEGKAEKDALLIIPDFL
jgi:hypothetical protein